MFDHNLKDENYINYIKLFWLLHNTEEGPEADKLRDEMDKIWAMLNQEQIDLSNHISAVFYIIKDDNV